MSLTGRAISCNCPKSIINCPHSSKYNYPDQTTHYKSIKGNLENENYSQKDNNQNIHMSPYMCKISSRVRYGDRMS
jgi:hypothetical protein